MSPSRNAWRGGAYTTVFSERCGIVLPLSCRPAADRRKEAELLGGGGRAAEVGRGQEARAPSKSGARERRGRRRIERRGGESCELFREAGGPQEDTEIAAAVHVGDRAQDRDAAAALLEGPRQPREHVAPAAADSSQEIEVPGRHGDERHSPVLGRGD